jgi:hypothetical protein
MLRLVPLLACLLLVPAAATQAAERSRPAAAPPFAVGISDFANAYFDPGGTFFPTLARLRAGVVRVQLNWGGRFGVARRRPVDGSDPDDPAYDWRAYDRVVRQAAAHDVEVLFTIFGTPAWANGGQPPNRAPRDETRLEEFAFAAATRYSGEHRGHDGRLLPAVRLWSAWNEPNLQLGLVPQWKRERGRWVIQSARDYARICNAIVSGVHGSPLVGGKVACGETAPRGNNNPRGDRPSVAPLPFLRALAKAGATGFDAYAHHAYYGAPFETPSTMPRGAGAVTLASIHRLFGELDRLYGRKRVWITEWGYQTNPPDRIFGVSPARQALYLKQGYARAAANPRIDMLLWFLLRDEEDTDRWQSGLLDAAGAPKPAFAAFQAVASPTASR